MHEDLEFQDLPENKPLEMPATCIGAAFDGNKISVFCTFKDDSLETAEKLGLMLYLMNAGYFKEVFIEELAKLVTDHPILIKQIADAWYSSKAYFENTPEISSREVVKPMDMSFLPKGQ